MSWSPERYELSVSLGGSSPSASSCTLRLQFSVAESVAAVTLLVPQEPQLLPDQQQSQTHSHEGEGGPDALLRASGGILVRSAVVESTKRGREDTRCKFFTVNLEEKVKEEEVGELDDRGDDVLQPVPPLPDGRGPLGSVLRRLVVESPTGSFSPGFHVLRIDFACRLRDDMLGMYSPLSVPNSSDTAAPAKRGRGAKRRGAGAPSGSSSSAEGSLDAFALVYTHLEPAFAPLWFPCASVDNSVRVPLGLTVVTPQSELGRSDAYDVVSNGPTAARRQLANGTWEFKFEDTPPLPAYLYCMACGQWEAKSFQLAGSAELDARVMVPVSGSKKQSASQIEEVLQLVSDATSTSFRELASLLGVDTLIDLPKLDVVCLPSMILSGMEHHGCIFIHVPPGELRASSVQRDVLHEVAHLWVGNSVGMSLGAKEGVVQLIERALEKKLFGKAQAGRGDRAAGGSLSQAHASTAVEVFHKTMNERLYAEFMDNMCKLLELDPVQVGDKFWAAVQKLLHVYSGEYVSDETIWRELP
jgi:Peptidase family M1 domain